MRRSTSVVAFCAGALMSTITGSAHADAQAEDLFQQGKAAMVRHEYSRACPLFEASKKLEDTLGTLLNLADCHQQIGKVATAWGEFTEAEQRARAAKPPKEERAVFAHERAEALRKQLPRVKLKVPDAARVEGLTITVDGRLVPPEAWDVGVPVDPGLRKISAAAPGKKTWSTETRVDPVEGESLVVPVDVEVLKDAPKVVTPPPPRAGTDATEIEAVATARARRTAGYVVGGIGIAGLAVGGIMGGLGFAAIGDEHDACKRGDCYKDAFGKSDSYQKAETARNNATIDINVASVAGGVGLAALGVGIYLIVTSSPKVAPKTAITPVVAPGHGGLSVMGQF